jgi:D-alanyl-D-alanine carboxypeptidase/D-alanyl-D-alanine-endopeptidase (penicillin-binding protein 4)
MESLVLMDGSFREARFGSGWTWDDYNSSYSPELSAFPIYSNLASFTLDSISKEVKVTPSFLQDSIIIEQGERFGVERIESANIYKVTVGECNDCERQRPYRLTKEMIAALYSDTLKIPVALDTLMRPLDAKTLYGQPQDSVLKVMMQESDNFLAEQLLLQVGAELTDTLDTRMAIDTIQSYLQQFLPDSAIWVDGSGLSRYNMITPRSVVYLWKEVIAMVGEEQLKQIIAEGGVSGTIENWYAREPSYVYGKTGTLRHNHNLSGLLITKSGKTLLFSFMHNHFSTSTTPIKQEMERVLQMIYEKY